MMHYGWGLFCILAGCEGKSRFSRIGSGRHLLVLIIPAKA